MAAIHHVATPSGLRMVQIQEAWACRPQRSSTAGAESLARLHVSGQPNGAAAPCASHSIRRSAAGVKTHRLSQLLR